jgi:hypothetical protein
MQIDLRRQHLCFLIPVDNSLGACLQWCFLRLFFVFAMGKDAHQYIFYPRFCLHRFHSRFRFLVRDCAKLVPRPSRYAQSRRLEADGIYEKSICVFEHRERKYGRKKRQWKQTLSQCCHLTIVVLFSEPKGDRDMMVV